jgi:hypothetical protein
MKYITAKTAKMPLLGRHLFGFYFVVSLIFVKHRRQEKAKERAKHHWQNATGWIFFKKGLYCSDSSYKQTQVCTIVPYTNWELRFALVSRAGDTYCNGNNGRGSENITQRKNTAAGGWGTMLRVKRVLFVYVCIFCIVGGDPLGCSYWWHVQEGLYDWRRYQKSERSY